MADKLRIGALGLVHDHVWGNLDELAEVPGAELVAAADPNEPLLDRAKEAYGCAIYAHHRDLLDQEELDAVYIFSDNATSVGLAERAAERGLHILVEKPMASDLAGADQMLAAARRAGVRLMVNWPFAWWAGLQRGLAMASSGDLGQVWQIKYRAAHGGPREMGCSEYFWGWLYDRERNGGGAMMDYACYGAALARLVLGMPSRVWATAGRLCKEDITLEDNGLVVMTYPRATALAEASWTQIGKLTTYETVIYGTEGTLFIERRGGRVLLATREQPDGVKLTVPESPGQMTSASAHFVHALEGGEPFYELCGDRVARDAQEILEAAFLSAGTGEEVSLPLATCLDE